MNLSVAAQTQSQYEGNSTRERYTRDKIPQTVICRRGIHTDTQL